jgi:hypothetical protein
VKPVATSFDLPRRGCQFDYKDIYRCMHLLADIGGSEEEQAAIAVGLAGSSERAYVPLSAQECYPGVRRVFWSPN